MAQDAPDSPAWIWTRRQRTAIAVAALLVIGYLAIRAAQHSMRVDDPPTPQGPRAGEVMRRLDPNTADAAALAALPVIGAKRAAEIVEYRQTFLIEHPDRLAFETPDDLMNVKGIGKATLQTLEPHLVFPVRLPSTKPTMQ